MMILLTKMNKDRFLVNFNQVAYIEFIPETRIVMMNHDYYLVRETGDEIIQKLAEYSAKVMDIHRPLVVEDRRGK